VNIVIIVSLGQPEMTLFNPLVERDSAYPVAMCVTAGLRTRDINVTWQFEGGLKEMSTILGVTEVRGEDTFTFKAMYSRPVSMEDNGKTLRCTVEYQNLKAPLYAEGTLRVLCKCLFFISFVIF